MKDFKLHATSVYSNLQFLPSATTFITLLWQYDALTHLVCGDRHNTKKKMHTFRINDDEKERSQDEDAYHVSYSTHVILHIMKIYHVIVRKI
jgi:hypothetical protein